MRPIRFSLRRMMRNWQLKLAALALAVLLWVLVRAEQPTEQWIQVRVETQLLDPAYTLTAPPAPRVVQVRFAGKWREIGELALEKPVLVLHVRNVGRQRTFVLEPAMVRLPDGARGRVSALDVRPGLVKLALQPVPDTPPAPLR